MSKKSQHQEKLAKLQASLKNKIDEPQLDSYNAATLSDYNVATLESDSVTTVIQNNPTTSEDDKQTEPKEQGRVRKKYKHVSWYPENPEIVRKLKQLGLDEDRKVTDLISEAVREMLKRKGLVV